MPTPEATDATNTVPADPSPDFATDQGSPAPEGPVAEQDPGPSSATPPGGEGSGPEPQDETVVVSRALI